MSEPVHCICLGEGPTPGSVQRSPQQEVELATDFSSATCKASTLGTRISPAPYKNFRNKTDISVDYSLCSARRKPAAVLSTRSGPKATTAATRSQTHLQAINNTNHKIMLSGGQQVRRWPGMLQAWA